MLAEGWILTIGVAGLSALLACVLSLVFSVGLWEADRSPRCSVIGLLYDAFEFLASLPPFLLAALWAGVFVLLGMHSMLGVICALALSGVPLLSLQYLQILKRVPPRLRESILALGGTSFQALELAQLRPMKRAIVARTVRFGLRVCVDVASLETLWKVFGFSSTGEWSSIFGISLLTGARPLPSAVFFCVFIWVLYISTEGVFSRQERLWRKAT